MPSVPLIDSTNTKQSFSVGADADGLSMARVLLDDTMPTYVASATFTPLATAALTLLNIQGSASKTIRIKGIFVGGHSTANAETTFGLQKTSTQGTGGTAVPVTAGKLRTKFPNASAVVQHFTTGAQSRGTAIGGSLGVQEFFTGVITTPTVYTPMQAFWPVPGQFGAIVLDGASEFLELVNLNAGNLSTATVLTYSIIWTEDAS